jgi:hypothetical protein
MKSVLCLALLYLSALGCLPADVCDPGQFQGPGNLCVSFPDAGPDSGLLPDGGLDGGTDGG